MNINMMNRNINNLIQITWNVQHLFKQSHYVTVQRLIRTTQHELRDDENKRRRRFRPVNNLPASPFNYEDSISDWRKCTNYYDVFSKIKRKHENMTAEDAVMALNTLLKLDKDCQIKQNITKLDEFNTLCKILKKDMRSLSLNHIINALKALNYFKVPSSSVVVQMLLQLIRYSINQLSMDQGIFLIFLLPKLQKTPLVEALLIALPLVLQTNVKTKLNVENIHSLISSLEYFANQKVIDETILIHIINTLNSNKDQSINTANAMKLLFVLLQVKENLMNMELLLKVYDILSETIHDIQNTSLLPIFIHKIASKVKPTGNIFYNAKFIDACIAKIISAKPKIEDAIVTIDHLNLFFHSNNEILDYVIDRSIKTQHFSKSTKIKERMSLITAMSITDHKPNSWEVLKESILIDGLLDLTFDEKLKLSIKLLSFDCYWPKLIEKVFDSYGAEKIMNLRSKKRLMILHHTVKNFYPQYYGPFLLNDDVNLFHSLCGIKSFNPSLKVALESIVGGPEYVLPNLQTQYGDFIDFAVIMRKGGYPVALNNVEEPKSFYLKDIELPKDSQIFLFIFIASEAHSLNTHCLAPSLRLFQKLLEINPNHAVINILGDQWSGLTEPSRLKYLSDAIKLKTNQESVDSIMQQSRADVPCGYLVQKTRKSLTTRGLGFQQVLYLGNQDDLITEGISNENHYRLTKTIAKFVLVPGFHGCILQNENRSICWLTFCG